MPLMSSSHCFSLLILLYRIFCLLRLLRGTRCLCMCCLESWTPVSTCPSLCVMHRIVLPMWNAQYIATCSNARSSGGRVPSTEWRQSRSCSFSASGNTLPSSALVYVCVTNFLTFCMFRVFSLWWFRIWLSLRGVCLSSLSLNLTSTSWLPNCDHTIYRAFTGFDRDT